MRVKWVGSKPTAHQVRSDSDTLPNIYNDFLPLAVISKVSLVLPIRDVFQGMKNLNFKWFSLEIISILVLNPCIGYIIPTQIPSNDFYPSAKEALVYFLSNLWFVYGQETLISLLEKIDQFDHSLNFDSKINYHKKLNKFVWPCMVCIYPTVLLGRVFLSFYNQEHCSKNKCALMEIPRCFFCYQHHLQMAIFTFFCYEIKIRFKTLNNVFCDFLRKTYRHEPIVIENHEQLEVQRLQYTRLIQCTKTLNQLFGWRFAFIFASIIMYVVWLLYLFHTEEGYIITGYDVLATVFSFILLFVLTHNTDLLVIESQKLERYICEISTQDLNWTSLFQLDHALHQCEMFQVQISASEMVTVDKSLLLGMVGAVSVYFIAILQMTTTRGSFSW